MVCKKGDGNGKSFWSATTADRVILPNGVTRWCLFSADDECCLYPVERIEDGSVKIVEDSDDVSHPPHYAKGWSNGSEVIDLTEHLSFCAGNVVKYVCRAGRKDPDKHVEDLEKARWYLDREIERVKRH